MKAKALGIGVTLALLTTGSAFALVADGSSTGGTEVVSYPHLGVQLLQSFSFNFSNADHHIRTIGAMVDRPNNGQLEVSYFDQDKNDDYSFHIRHFDAAPAGIAAVDVGPNTCFVGSCTVAIPRPPGQNIFVLRGFKVEYVTDDHEIDQFSILESNGNLTVAFNDGNNDDDFRWSVQYAYVPLSRFSQIASSAGVSSGPASALTFPGNAVIRGFNFDFRGVDTDNHIDGIAIIQSGDGAVHVVYQDQNSSGDAFDWSVQWATIPQ